ncbi:SusD/RagB family nutrient-binding outer membrane lipoprotein [Olivibacter sp. SDN3]|nr:SusD/RagB family nutrient-binding outer membrane lipoprotein [Olivibacter sp. SDN3]
MYKNIGKSIFAFALSFTAVSCSKFDEINVDPKVASIDQVQVEYFINAAIVGAQQDPHVAERAFVLYWKTAGRQHRSNGLSTGVYTDDWSQDYYSAASGWLNAAYTAVEVAEHQMETGEAQPYTNNLLQVARIWRAYLLSELADNFGPLPINGFQGENPSFNNLQEVYYFMLQELKEAVEAIDPSVTNPDVLRNFDHAYNFDYNKWIKYGNSLRMRFAMRLSEVDPGKAQSEFEDAIRGGLYITTMDEAFQVTERPGWDGLTGVMSREWNGQQISATLNNLYLGLGGIPSENQLGTNLHQYVKDEDYIGLRFSEHFSTLTNDPSAGYWLDGLPKVIDPRAYKTFAIPGDLNNPDFSRYPTYTQDAVTTSRNLVNANDGVVKTIEARYTWNAFAIGNWGLKGARNQVYTYLGTNPRLVQRYRSSDNVRIFFAPWETNFLLAEAGVRGWSTPVAAKEAYEQGVRLSFDYNNVGAHLGQYLSSTNYNRVGTSVSWDHTPEPPASHRMTFVDGYANTTGTVDIPYPSNTLYRNGAVKNDHLTKIITQKFIAQCPWLPLETWSDHRRLGLPFFETPAVEEPNTNLPDLTRSNYMNASTKFFPQRLRYPSSLRNTNQQGYQQAVGFLEGEDGVLTPLWWAKR